MVIPDFDIESSTFSLSQSSTVRSIMRRRLCELFSDDSTLWCASLLVHCNELFKIVFDGGLLLSLVPLLVVSIFSDSEISCRDSWLLSLMLSSVLVDGSLSDNSELWFAELLVERNNLFTIVFDRWLLSLLASLLVSSTFVKWDYSCRGTQFLSLILPSLLLDDASFFSNSSFRKFRTGSVQI